MVIETADIREKIDMDFGAKASLVNDILDDAISKTHYLNNDRTIRCILLLADKDIDKLRTNIESAVFDPRDVMFWAEYINREMEQPKRIRDFNKPFDKAYEDVQE